MTEVIFEVRIRTEQRGNYNINVYDIDITENMRNECLQFAKDIVLTDNQYSRLLPTQIKESGDVSLQQKIEVQRTYIGKLGELVFLTFLKIKGKEVDMQGMFDVFVGQENVDGYDFITRDNKTVDIKTGFRGIHRRLLINCDQFNNIPKDYYVAVKLNAIDVDSELTLVNWDDITTGTIMGYSDYAYLNRYAKVRDFGEGDAKYIDYNRMMGIDRLVREF
ncbi:hypothetical protein [Catenibacterium sp. RTP21428st1_D7_RTP21428_210409]|uniref:hypothetical protein n=1 Tax=Catenibacterium sp. RTP21428st1_D7_RTP21428_210409 TaxID=3153688 RepID=UPI0032EDE521